MRCQLGLWCSDNSDNDFDDFKVQDVAGPFEVDGKWFCNRAEVRVDNSDNNVLETCGSATDLQQIVRRGFRSDKYVATYKFKWDSSIKPGFLARWIDPGNWFAIEIDTSDGKTRLKRRKDDGLVTTLPTASPTLSLTPGNWYTAKVVVDDADLNNPGPQRVRFWVDTDDDGDWSAGHVGLYKGDGMSTTHQFDDVEIGLDSNADGDLADANDLTCVSDNFNSTTWLGRLPVGRFSKQGYSGFSRL